MPTRVHIVPPDYSSVDLFHVDRWMCPRCGLILDYQFEPGEAGWPRFDPPLDQPDMWVDDKGEIRFEEPKREEFCARCDLNFEEQTPVRISISRAIDLNDLLPIIEQGEGRAIDFMTEFPGNAKHLQDAIAAFAATEGGRVLLGVDNKGEIVGLTHATSPKERDDLQQRVRGLLAHISPRPEIRIDFFSGLRGEVVAVLTIPKEPSSIYLSDNVPYIRDLDQSRPATKEEIERLVKAAQS